MKNKNKEWPIWACILTTAVVLAIPFLFVIKIPVLATIGWALTVLFYVLTLVVFGKGHVIEGAVMAFILAVLAATLIPMIHNRLEHKQGTANKPAQPPITCPRD